MFDLLISKPALNPPEGKLLILNEKGKTLFKKVYDKGSASEIIVEQKAFIHQYGTSAVEPSIPWDYTAIFFPKKASFSDICFPLVKEALKANHIAVKVFGTIAMFFLDLLTMPIRVVTSFFIKIEVKEDHCLVKFLKDNNNELDPKDVTDILSISVQTVYDTAINRRENDEDFLWNRHTVIETGLRQVAIRPVDNFVAANTSRWLTQTEIQKCR